MKKEALLRELVKLTATEGLRPDEFTMAEYIDECLKSNPRATRAACRSRIYAMIAEKKLKSRKVIINGHSCSAFSKA